MSDWNPYDVLAECTEGIVNLHKMNQVQALQISQMNTFICQMNTQLLQLSERIYRLEQNDK